VKEGRSVWLRLGLGLGSFVGWTTYRSPGVGGAFAAAFLDLEPDSSRGKWLALVG
jgi:hypothetical protein